MAFAVFEVPGADYQKAQQVLADDQVSRLSILEKDGQAYGLPAGSKLVMVEGDDDKVQHAAKLFGLFAKRPQDEAAIREKIKAEEDEAAGGVGFIFG